ncbi:Werner Syndrome-like exonuclease [Cucumis melo var. makuwa]|uniref:Werner Syndrome-like exonuclease n=1 Tax=Cucumis melo var. makuwa TaxID=1194695 RepID=A0A5A7SNJ2_CUCMM|nr:Werner Syndrome-like exonuclease [Cucumis melo var. makuwa]
MEDDTFPFIGVGINNDILKLYNDYDLNVANIIDLRELATDEMQSDELRIVILMTLGREVLGREIEKFF